MQAYKNTVLSLVLFLFVFISQRLDAQESVNLTNANGGVQQSLQTLLSAASSAGPNQLPFPIGRPSDPTPATTHEKFATFLAGEDFTSVLLLENVRPDLPITFRPALILNGREVQLDSVTVPAHSSTTVDLSMMLKNRGITERTGTVAIRFDFSSYGPGIAVVQMKDDKHHVYLNSYAQSPEEYWSGTSYDAVVWTPDEGSKGFVSVINTSTEMHSVDVVFTVRGTERHTQIEIPAGQTRMLPIDDLLARSLRSGAGIHIEYTQGADEEYTGAILVDGQVFNKKTGFAKNIHFMDKALPPTGTLRTHFLMLGQQPAGDNFPADVAFRSVAAVRNIDGVPVTITPVVRFLRDQAVETVKLSSRTIAPAESMLIDFAEEQKEGHLPADFTQGSLELTPDTNRASIVGELFNFSQTGGYVVGSSFSSYPTRSTSSIWRTDGSFQTTIMMENTATENDRVTMNLYSERGQYSKTFDLSAGKLLKINVRDLQRQGIPDDKGNLLLDTSGVMSLVASHNARSRISFDKIIHNSDQSDYVGLPLDPCDFVTSISLFLEGPNSTGEFPVMKTYFWSQAGPADEAETGSFGSDASLVHITNNGTGDMATFTPPNDGQTYSVTINPPFPTEITQFCDACSFGEVTAIPIIPPILIRIALTSWGPPPTVIGDGCSWHNLACASGTPHCTLGFSVTFVPSCPNYVLSQTVVVNGLCVPPSIVEAATGPGPCN